MAATSTRVSEERKLRDEIAKANREYKKIKQRNKNFNVDLDEEEAAAKTALENAKEALETYKQERQESLTQKGNETKVKTLQTRILSEQSRLEGLKSPDREGGFLIAPATKDRVRNLEKSIYEKEQEIKRLGGELRTPTKFDLYKPAVEEQPSVSASERPLDDAELKKLQIGGSPATKQIISGFSSDDFKNIQVAGTAGTFAVLDKFDEDPVGYYILPTDATGVSEFVAVAKFVNNLYTLDSDVVSNYQKALNLSVSGVMNPVLEEKITNLVDSVSYLNYRNAIAGNSKQIKWEEALLDPAKFNLGKALGTGGGPSSEQVKVKTESIKVISTELGIDLDNSNLQKLARDWASGLYDATTIKSQIARLGNIDFTKGLAGETVSILKQYASDFGVQYDDSWFTRAATNILKAKESEDTYNNQIREIAKSRYPTLSSQIDAGFTVRQLASPYLQSMSRVLEIDAGTIGLEDPTITRSLTGLNQEGKPGTTPLWQFEQELRKDPRWNFTKNAQDSLMNTTRKVLQDFGLVS